MIILDATFRQLSKYLVTSCLIINKIFTSGINDYNDIKKFQGFVMTKPKHSHTLPHLHINPSHSGNNCACNFLHVIVRTVQNLLSLLYCIFILMSLDSFKRQLLAIHTLFIAMTTLCLEESASS